MENGKSHNLPRSVNIYKKEKIDAQSLQEILEALKDAVIANTSSLEVVQKEVTDISIKIQPVVNFHRNMRVAVAIMFLPFYFFIGKDGQGWVKEILFK